MLFYIITYPFVLCKYGEFFATDNLPYENDTPFEIPDSWQWIKHNDIFEISGGSQPPKSKFRNEKLENYIRLYQIRDYGENPVPVYIPLSTASKRTKKGDILLARYGASLGKVFWAEDGAYNVAMAKVIPIFSCVNEIIDKEYLFYYYHTDLYRSVIFNNSRSAQAGFNKEDLDNMWFPLPPKEEQRRIVLALNNVLPYIEEYSVAERKLQGYNKEFPEMLKKSILQEAVQGKLVPQDPNDEPASVLLERIRAEKEQLIKEGKIKKDKHESVIFRRDNSHYEKCGNEEVCIDDCTPFEIPESWVWTRLKNIVTKEIKRGKSPQYANTSNILVFAQKCNVKTGGIDMSLAKFLNPVTFSKYPTEEIMQNKDIVINSTGRGTLGRIGIFSDSDRINSFPIVPDSHVTIVRTSESFEEKYLYYVLKYYQPYLEGLGEGSTNQTELKPAVISELLIPVPPYSEQMRIVHTLEQVLARTGQI